jgi:hypothetical protein
MDPCRRRIGAALAVLNTLHLAAAAAAAGAVPPPAASAAARPVAGAVAGSGAPSAGDLHVDAAKRYWQSLAAVGFRGVGLVARDGRVLLLEGSGGVSPQATFNIASIAKSLTAVAVLRAAQRGALSLDDPLSRFFPDAPADKRGITVHQLLTHTGGIGNSTGDTATGVKDRTEAVRMILATPLIGPPGKGHSYSNDGYTAGPGGSGPGPATVRTFLLDSTSGLELLNVKADVQTYRGRRALRLVEEPAGATGGGDAMAFLAGSDFKDGTIEVDVAGAPRRGAFEGARGFIGIAFRVQPRAAAYEYFYLRPTNGRAEDQLRRNHATQYASQPDYPWERLRKEQPGVYESYVDLESGAWTHLKIVVSGTDARLYVHGADQPCLLVHDLKLGDSRGRIALWIGLDTEGYFSHLTVE